MKEGTSLEVPIDIKSTIGAYYEQLYDNKFNNLDEVANISKSTSY